MHDDAVDLSQWRVAGIGGEMVHAHPLKAFAEAFAPYGFKPEAFTPSYGMAEATLAISFSDVDKPINIDAIDKQALLEGKAVPTAETTAAETPNTRVMVSCGRMLKGYELQIRDPKNNLLADRKIGRICVRTPSLMSGYFHDAEATQESLLADGWLDTGDMGYTLNGELIITGRAKDMIIINGRNFWPQDMEWHAEQSVDMLRARDTAAFAVQTADGKEEAVLLVQTRTLDPEKQAELIKQVAVAVKTNTGVDAKVVLVPQRSLPYTTSGKLSRAKAKKAYLSGELEPLNLSEKEPAA